MSANSRYILCVDDDPDDHALVCDSIKEIDPGMEIIQAQNGDEALKHLKNAKAETNLPCLVILDINMPRMDGKQTLMHIKKDDQLTKIPVVMLSTSGNSVDKLFCAHYGVELYTKPSNIAEYSGIIKKLLSYCTT